MENLRQFRPVFVISGRGSTATAMTQAGKTYIIPEIYITHKYLNN
jgi:hypothetical protein